MSMNDDLIAKLKTPEDCEQFGINVEQRGKPELALAARQRAVELRAAAHNASTAAEREALEAVYAYERILFSKRGRKIRASRTWQMIDKRGIIPAIEQVVTRSSESTGYAPLMQMGMQDKSFEAVVLRHPEVFSAEAVRRSKERLERS
jgi:hypothetical protein